MWAVCLLLGAVSCATAEVVPTRGTVDPRIRTVLYRADEVYKLYGAAGYAIELVFEEGEVFMGRAGGDLDGVAIDGFKNRVQLKPRAAVVATNLVIYTNRRVYHFDYSSSEQMAERWSERAMYAVEFRYPPSPTAKSDEPAPERPEETLATAERPARNLDYWYCGHPALKPVAASDDGVHTRLEFGARAEMPAVFVSNEDGSESLLNFNVEDGDIVIHRVARRFVVRRGRLTGCIVNQGFAGVGERLDSGTLSPEVWRKRKAVRP